MYTKTRSTLAGMTAASLFVLAGWLFGHPVVPTQSSSEIAPTTPMVSIAIAADAPVDLLSDARSGLPAQATTANSRNTSRMSLAMPYFSFALLRPRKGIN